jgi:hypothetical protein
MIVYHIYPHFHMNAKSITSIVLIILGFAVLAYSGISFTTPGETVRFLGIRIQTRETHFIPPIVGALALIGGFVLLALKPRSV